MIGKIIWPRTGDEIPFRPVWPDLLEYYVDNLRSHSKNSFRRVETLISAEHPARLSENIERTSVVERHGIKILNDTNGDLLDQKLLNQIHRDWVVSGQKYPALPLLLRSIGNLDSEYRDINISVHRIENMFISQYCNYDKDPYRIDNPFGSKILGFDTNNIMIGFDNLGRNSWEKFMHWDLNIDDVDTNDFQQLSGLLDVNLFRPMKWQPPENYVSWCNQHSRPVMGNRVCLGTFVDLAEKLTDYRHIMLRNNADSDTIMVDMA